MADIVCDSEYFRDALALLNMKALTDEALAEQAEFWNEAAQMADEDARRRVSGPLPQPH